MLAYMIYEKEEGEKNKGFIELFQREGMRVGISFLFVSKEAYQEEPLPDLVLNRTRDSAVSLWYEERNIPVLHSSTVVELGNDKWKTYQFLREHMAESGQLLPDTLYLPGFSKKRLYQSIEKEGWGTEKNLVLKTVNGHGGSEVFLLPANFKEETLDPVFQLLSGRSCILQEQIKSRAMDVRVYIVGNRMYHGVLRKGERDFRSNFSLGGKVQEYEFSKEETALIQSVLHAFSEHTLGLVGMDFIVSEDGRLVFNELEEMAGCRMLYACSKKNIVGDYVMWIQGMMNQRAKSSRPV